MKTVLAGLFFACGVIGLCSLPAFSFGRAAAGEVEPGVGKDLRENHRELLMEKGLLDDRGIEIGGRLGALIHTARGRGFKLEKDIGRFILGELGDSSGDLAGFPSCAFDRPFGHKLGRYGHTAAAGTIDATSEGSACPAGGIGAGGYEWTISGNFRTWFLKPGWMVDDTVWANQFHVFFKSGGRTAVQTLSADSAGGKLQSWKWNYPQGKGTYYALFPKSGFSYEKNEAFPARAAVVQFSPVIPHNYRETSYPVAVYRWIIKNPGPEPLDASVMLTWENMVGWEPVPAGAAQAELYAWDRNGLDSVNEFVEEGPNRGILFRKKSLDMRKGNAMSGSMCIAAREIPGKAQVYYLADFDPNGGGEEVWKAFSLDGRLPNAKESRSGGSGDELAGAIAVRVSLGANEEIQFPMAVAWDFPYYEFEKGIKYAKKYTQFFGRSGLKAFAIACDALNNCGEWEKAIDEWQKEIVGDRALPDWLKQALFNELYVLAETSIWDATTNLQTYLESTDYLMYGTFDVDAYSSWHLLRLWPELEMNTMRFFARAVAMEDPAYKSYRYAEVMPREVPPDKAPYYWDINKDRGMVPHDLGSPRGRPWVVLNGFDWQNGNVWKDLNPKFPLRALRDYLFACAGDGEFLKTMFSASVTALDTLERKFGDPRSHVPLNEGIPDQTYDTWRMKGESAYVGLLWLASLRAASRMGELLLEQGTDVAGDLDVRRAIDRYESWFKAGQSAVQRLWDGKAGYFHIDAQSDDVMADQLFGVWYAAMLGIEEAKGDPIIPGEQVLKTLRTIHRLNVLGYGDGLMGAVNGRTASGRQLLSQQGDEVWAGAAYAYASNCILHGLVEEGMHTAYGVYHVVYSPFGQGYYFKTPEAYLNPEEARWNDPGRAYGDELFRAMKYMRPGAVWAVYEALLKKRN